MAGVSITGRIDDRALQQRLRKMQGGLRKALAPIGMALIKGTQERFRAGHGPGGAGWAALHPMYAPIKRGPGILRASGLLMRSISSQIGSSEVRVGTNRIYARVHQFGAVIRPKRAKFLRFMMADGPWAVRSVTIPQRPFLGIDDRDREEIQDVIEALLMRP